MTVVKSIGLFLWKIFKEFFALLNAFDVVAFVIDNIISLVDVAVDSNNDIIVI